MSLKPPPFAADRVRLECAEIIPAEALGDHSRTGSASRICASNLLWSDETALTEAAVPLAARIEQRHDLPNLQCQELVLHLSTLGQSPFRHIALVAGKPGLSCRLMAKKEWQRTCKRCETHWFAPIESKPNRMEIAGHKMQGTGSRMTLFGGRRAASSETRAQSLEAKRARMEALERCPNCGSQAYSQAKVKV